MANTTNTCVINITFTKATSRSNIVSGDNLSNACGKIAKYIETSAGEIVAGKSYVIDGIGYIAGDGAEVFNDYTDNKAVGNYSHAEGSDTIASAMCSHAEGLGTTAVGASSHAEGVGTTAGGVSSHSEGNNTSAGGLSSHAEGDGCNAYGAKSHAEGLGTTTGDSSDNTKGLAAHVEGNGTTASGASSHAEGRNTVASGDYSHAEGYYTKASSDNQHVEGKYNIEDTQNKYAHIIGCGTATNARKNAYCVDWSGKIYQPQDPNADPNGVYLSSKVNTSALAPVATSGSFSDLYNKPSVSSVGGVGKYIQSIKQTSGVISATAVSLDTTVSSSTSIAPTSNAVYNALALKTNNTATDVLTTTNAKNKFHKQANRPTTVVDNNVTLTWQSDGTIALSGTASAQTTFYLGLGYDGSEFVTGDILSGVPSESSGITLCIQLSTSPYTKYANDTGSGATIPSSIVAGSTYRILLVISSNTNVTGKVIKPMICSPHLWSISNTYQPYAPTNSELHEVLDNSIKNMFNLDAWKSVTVNNGSVTVSGNKVTLAATGNNCFTSYNLPPNGSYPYNAVMLVNEGDEIVFTWNYKANNSQTNDKVYLFRNGSAATGNFIQVSASTQILEYTVPADTSYITIRFDVPTSGYSAEFSNIMVCKKELYSISQSYQPYKYDSHVDLIPAENSMNPITSDGVYQPVSENINNGVKNISRWSGGTAASANQTIASKIPITTDGDTYVISYTTSLTTGYITVGIKDANDGLVVSAIQINNSGTKTAVVTIPSNAAYFNIVSSVAGTYSNFMICKKKLYNLSGDYRPYAPSNSELYEMIGNINAEADAVANAGAKNMLTLNPPSTSSGGVTLALNTDGTITTTGGTSTSYTALQLNTITLPAGEYILSGCPTGGADNTYRLDISGTQYYDTGSGVKFTSTGTAMTIRIRIGANTSVNGFIWKPMIRNAAIADSTFRQYAPTNRELYEMILALYNRGTS